MSTGGPHPRRRHATSSGMGAGGAVTRDTHGIGFSPVPTDPLYGSIIDTEAISPVDMPQIIVADDVIVPGTISTVLFAESIRAPTVVDVLPTLPDDGYPTGSLVFYTPDGKLYRNVAEAWTVEVDGADILANSITAGQIAAGAIGADEIAAGSIRTEHLSVGHIRANLLVNGDFDTFSGTVAAYQLTSPFVGWDVVGDLEVTASESVNVKSGTYICVMRSPTGLATTSGLNQFIPVRIGRTYRLSGWGWKGTSGGGNAQILAHSYAKDGSLVGFNTMVAVSSNSSTPTFGEAFLTIPAGTATLRVQARCSGTPTTSEVFAFDSVTLEEVPGGASNGPGEVVINNTGIAVTNGKITVTNGSSVVIIDGTSNMFKIVAEGTVTVPSGANTQLVTATVTTNLGSTVPAGLFYLYNTGTLYTQPLPVLDLNGAAGTFTINIIQEGWLDRPATNQTRVNIRRRTGGAAVAASTFKYFIMKEAVI